MVNKSNKKYIVVLGDGMPDYPLQELGGKTPLEYARTPHLDMLAGRGVMGLARTVPEGLPPGSDVANLSALGYDPVKYYTGRSPLEAAGMGIELEAADLTLRCNLVTLSEEDSYNAKKMLDYSAGEIGSAEAAVLIEEIGKSLGNETLKFHNGFSYRHLLIWKEGPGPELFELTPPHDISGEVIWSFLPGGEKGGIILSLMEKSAAILAKHPINTQRRGQGLSPANSIWLWGEGRKPNLEAFRDKYGFEGGVISAVDLIKGLGRCMSLEVADVQGATGTIHTNYAGKVSAAFDFLAGGLDFVFLHIEAPDEAGHQGELETKIRAIEDVDTKVVGELLRGLEDFRDYRLLVLSDHPTPLSRRTHTREDVPFCIYDKSDQKRQATGRNYSEKDAAAAVADVPMFFFDPGWTLMGHFLGK